MIEVKFVTVQLVDDQVELEYELLFANWFVA